MSDSTDIFRGLEETPEQAADGILEGLEYLAREAHRAGLPELAKAITAIIMDPESWSDLKS